MAASFAGAWQPLQRQGVAYAQAAGLFGRGLQHDGQAPERASFHHGHLKHPGAARARR